MTVSGSSHQPDKMRTELAQLMAEMARLREDAKQLETRIQQLARQAGQAPNKSNASRGGDGAGA
jgi:hypothetical protein